jgi:hypothetical protein
MRRWPVRSRQLRRVKLVQNQALRKELQPRQRLKESYGKDSGEKSPGEKSPGEKDSRQEGGNSTRQCRRSY